MNSFYQVCKKKSRQMTELVIIGFIMVLFVIVSSWGTKIINYFHGPIHLENMQENLKTIKQKNSFDRNDPHNQYVKITVNRQQLKEIKSEIKKNKYFEYTSNANNKFYLSFDQEEVKELEKVWKENKEAEVLGGFDQLQGDEKNIGKHNISKETLIFRSGNIGDSKKIEIIVSIYGTIILVLLIILLLILECSNVFMHKTKKQISNMSVKEKNKIDKDFKERLREDKLGFGDTYLYLSKNWHYEIYQFSNLVLLYYRIHQYGHFDRYTLFGWTDKKKSFVIANMLTKKKLEQFLQLIYMRNPEITVEKTVQRRNLQLQYFSNLVEEMRDRQMISSQLEIVKNENQYFRKRKLRSMPLLRKKPISKINRTKKSAPNIHIHKKSKR